MLDELEVGKPLKENKLPLNIESDINKENVIMHA